MSVRVRIPTPLRGATDGSAEVVVEPATVSEVLGELEGRYPGIRGRLRDETGELRRFVNVYVNGEDVRFLQGLETRLAAGDELSIVPAVAGGSAGRAARPRRQAGGLLTAGPRPPAGPGRRR